MRNSREYEIPFVGLKPGVHEYFYTITDSFFEDRGEQEVENVQASVKLSLDKKQGFFQLKFEVGGTADVVCDKCGNNLIKDLWDEFNIVVKMVSNPDEMNAQEDDPDIYYISHTESHLQVEDWIYEFIVLSIPLQKMCKEEERGGPLCNVEVLEKLKKMEEEAQNSSNASIWKGLEKFKNN